MAVAERRKTAGCYFCGAQVDDEENRCYGCGEVICQDCNLNAGLVGRHDVMEHRESEDDEE